MAVGVTVGFIETGVVAAVADEADETVAAVGAGEEAGREATCCRVRGRCRWWRCRRPGCRWGR